MKNKILYSMMSENLNNGGNYLDRFIPIIEDCIASKYLDGFTPSIIMKDIEDEFNLNKPVTFYEEILNYLVSKDKLLCNIVDNMIFYTVKTGVIKHDFSKEKDDFYRHLDMIANEYIEYQKGNRIDIELGVARNRILGFIDKNFEIFSVDSMKGVDLSLIDHQGLEDLDNLSVACFFIDIYEKKSPVLECMSTLIKAVICYYYVYMDTTEKQIDLSKVTVFLDSPLIINLLGYNGEQFQTPILEIVNSLLDLGAKVEYFDHTEIEVQKILQACEYKIKYRDPGYGLARFTVEHFLSMDEPIVEIVKAQTELNTVRLPSFGVYAYEGDIYDTNWLNQRYRIDINALVKKISGEMTNHYNDLERADTDARSIYGVNFLRQGKKSDKIAECEAVFLTMNRRLTHISHSFLNENHNFIPTTLLYSQLSLLISSTNGCKYSNLPFDILVANCYAAISPPEKVWIQYVKNLNQSKNNKEITDADYAQLRSMGLLQSFSRSGQFAYDDVVNVPVKSLREAIEAKKQHDIHEAKELTRMNAEAEFMPQIKELLQKNDEIKKKVSSTESLIQDGIMKEKKAAETFAVRVTRGAAIILFAVILILNLACNFIGSPTVKIIISVCLAAIGSYGLLPFKKVALTNKLMNLHLKMFGKITRQFDLESEESLAECES